MSRLFAHSSVRLRFPSPELNTFIWNVAVRGPTHTQKCERFRVWPLLVPQSRPHSAASCLMGTGDTFHEVKRPGREANNSSPSGAEIKKEWSYISTPPHCAFLLCWGTTLPSTSDLTYDFFFHFPQQVLRDSLRAEGKNKWSDTFFPPVSFMTCTGTLPLP